MTDPQSTLPVPVPRRDLIGWSRFKRTFRSRLMGGLILILPIWITYVLVQFVFGLLRDASLWIVKLFLLSPGGAAWLATWNVKAEDLKARGLGALPAGIQWGLGALSIVLSIVLLYLLGVLATNVMGRRAIRMFEAMLDRVPFVKTVYRASKQVLDTFTGHEAPFQRVVSIPYPSADVRTIGLLTHVSHDPTTGEELWTVFVATTPNPTSGFLFILRRRDAVELDIPVEAAVKMYVSGGVLVPESLAMFGPKKPA